MSSPIETPSPLQQIRRALLREWLWQLAAAICLTTGGGLMTYFFFQVNTILSVFGLGALVGGLYFSYQVLKIRRVEDTPFWRLLHNNPKMIVWVYSVVTQRMPFGLQFFQNGILYLKLRNGDEVSLSLPAHTLKDVSSFLNEQLPHATFGYTEDRAQWFRAAPELLLREDPEQG
jgi:hypothetical protein